MEAVASPCCSSADSNAAFSSGRDRRRYSVFEEPGSRRLIVPALGFKRGSRTGTRSVCLNVLRDLANVNQGRVSCLMDLPDVVECEEVPEFVTRKALSELSTWGIGGPAKLFAEARDEIKLVSCIRYCRKHNIRFLILGKGSNCLFDDCGFNGCVILSRINMIQDNGLGKYRVGSGYPFNLLGIQTSKQGFSGLEFASGIPGTVGGAVFMNAGADGQETADVLEAVEIVDGDGRRHKLLKERGELMYSYRKSPFQTMQGLGAIVAATFQLQPCPNARVRQQDYLNRRKQSQPVKDRSAGCVFRNPGKGCNSAGALIEAAGLKGVTVGGAKVSEVHANFLINIGEAKASDVLSLISLVKNQVKVKLGVELEEEIRYMPYS